MCISEPPIQFLTVKFLDTYVFKIIDNVPEGSAPEASVNHRFNFPQRAVGLRPTVDLWSTFKEKFTP